MQAKSTASKKAHEIKNTAFAFGVYGDNSKRIADITVTDKGLVWSNGSSKAAKDVVVKWDDFIGWMKSQLPANTKAPAKAKKPAAAKAKAPANGAAKKASKPVKASTNGTKRTAAKKTPAKSRAASAAQPVLN